ncbi:MAG: hypothetical protein MZV70_28575 [Desulfobacterales bacterium]|nr:hypothetical protein [Desulfobacterales bacterium]
MSCLFARLLVIRRDDAPADHGIPVIQDCALTGCGRPLRESKLTLMPLSSTSEIVAGSSFIVDLTFTLARKERFVPHSGSKGGVPIQLRSVTAKSHTIADSLGPT